MFDMIIAMTIGFMDQRNIPKKFRELSKALTIFNQENKISGVKRELENGFIGIAPAPTLVLNQRSQKELQEIINHDDFAFLTDAVFTCTKKPKNPPPFVFSLPPHQKCEKVSNQFSRPCCHLDCKFIDCTFAHDISEFNFCFFLCPFGESCYNPRCSRFHVDSESGVEFLQRKRFFFLSDKIDAASKIQRMVRRFLNSIQKPFKKQIITLIPSQVKARRPEKTAYTTSIVQDSVPGGGPVKGSLTSHLRIDVNAESISENAYALNALIL